MDSGRDAVTMELAETRLLQPMQRVEEATRALEMVDTRASSVAHPALINFQLTASDHFDALVDRIVSVIELGHVCRFSRRSLRQRVYAAGSR